jgi:hypothetical protein
MTSIKSSCIEKQLCIDRLPLYFHLTDIIKSYVFEEVIIHEYKKKYKKIMNKSLYIICNTPWSRKILDDNDESWMFWVGDKIWVFYEEETDNIDIYETDLSHQFHATNCNKCGNYQILNTNYNETSKKYLFCLCQNNF